MPTDRAGLVRIMVQGRVARRAFLVPACGPYKLLGPTGLWWGHELWDLGLLGYLRARKGLSEGRRNFRLEGLCAGL